MPREAFAVNDSEPETGTLPEEKFRDAGSEYCEYSVKPGYEKEMEDVPEDVRKTVRLAHERLGHPRTTTLVRMLKISGARPDAIKYAKVLDCSVCNERQAPERPNKTTASVRPYGLGHLVHIDLKFVRDMAGKAYAALSDLCWYHAPRSMSG